jgi:4-diphosphocytidyl-2-C-methyl-D-erythritol kinase
MYKNRKRIIISAPAKINLYLEITGKLDSGYHSIESVMQTVDLYDTVIITAGDIINESFYDFEDDSDGAENVITLTCDDINVPLGKTNLAYAAADMFCKEYGIRNKQIDIEIKKRIPIAAGLAGGSADAAAVLIALNIIFGTRFSKPYLCKLGVKIGADVPFCIMKGTMFATGIGDVLTRCPAMPKCNILIVVGNTSVSSKWAYAEYDKYMSGGIPTPDNVMRGTLIKALKDGNLLYLCSNLYNIFENIITESDDYIKKMNKYNPINALMSGSGPSVYGIFADDETGRERALDAAEMFAKSGYKAFLCRPCESRELYIVEK